MNGIKRVPFDIGLAAEQISNIEMGVGHQRLFLVKQSHPLLVRPYSEYFPGVMLMHTSPGYPMSLGGLP